MTKIPGRFADRAVANEHDGSPGRGPAAAGATLPQRAAHDVPDVGAALRDARRQRGLSLDDIARATKIRVVILRAIEANRREQLPEPIYQRGFVRAYAREVGLDPEDTAARYVDQFQPVGGVGPSGASERVAIQPTDAPSTWEALGDSLAAARTQWLIIAVIVTLIGYGVVRWQQPPPPAISATSPAAGTTDADQSSPASRTSSRPEIGTVGSRESTADGPRVLHFEILSRGSCWLSITADGEQVVYRLMHAGEPQAFDVHRTATLRVGDPAALEFSINGSAGRSLGRAGEAVTVRVTPENYRDLLRQ